MTLVSGAKHSSHSVILLSHYSVDRMIPSRTSRELMMMSYLSQCLGPNARLLNDVTPYRVSWRDVAIDCGLEDVPREEIISTVNASMVALCTIPSERVSGRPCSV